MVQTTMWQALLDRLPRGYTLEEEDWQRRHRLLLWVLALHIPGLAIFALVLGSDPAVLAGSIAVPLMCLVLGRFLGRYRRTASVVVTAGLSYSSAALVVITQGSIEAHFHFFIIIGFIALYQDWAPFLFNIVFTILSHGMGSIFGQSLIFSHLSGQNNPWLWSLIHGVAVLFACVGMMLFWRVTEESQQQKEALQQRLAEAEIGRRQFASDMLVNLARRNQGMVYRQLDIINQLEESEQDPDALAELFKLDHLATRVRRNAESLLVLSGEQPARVWSEPIPLRDVVRAAIAETEDLDRVVFLVGDEPAVAGSAVTDLTHLLAELTENAVRFSPPDSSVTIRARPDPRGSGSQLLTVEDWGVGMPAEQLESTNQLLADPPEIDLSVSKRLGFHVVARLAARHDISVTLYATPGSGITAAISLPPALFESTGRPQPPKPLPPATPAPATVRATDGERVRRRPLPTHRGGLSAVADRRPAGADETTRLHAVPGATDPDRAPDFDPAPAPRPERTPAAAADPAPVADGTADRTADRGADRGIDGPTVAARLPADEVFQQTGWWGEPTTTDGSVPATAPRPSPAPRATANGSTAGNGNGHSNGSGSGSGNGNGSGSGSNGITGQPAAELRIIPGARDEPAPPAPPTRPAPAEGADQEGGVTADGAPFTLRRRVPQAHLTPELRQPTAPEPAAPAVPAASAASALSRYQASRQAARDVVDGEANGNGRGAGR